jgi:hypothetical protein
VGTPTLKEQTVRQRTEERKKQFDVGSRSPSSASLRFTNQGRVQFEIYTQRPGRWGRCFQGLEGVLFEEELLYRPTLFLSHAQCCPLQHSFRPYVFVPCSCSPERRLDGYPGDLLMADGLPSCRFGDGQHCNAHRIYEAWPQSNKGFSVRSIQAVWSTEKSKTRNEDC